MRSFAGFSSLTPQRLVLTALPILGLAAPNGLPFVEAACPSTATQGTVLMGVDYTDGCNNGTEDVVSVNHISLTWTSYKCEFTAPVSLTITLDDCVARWKTYCVDGSGAQKCDESVAGTGVLTNVTTSKTGKCGADGDEIRIDVEADGTQHGPCDNCTPIFVYRASGECETF